jgi:TatD DNase family protein
MIPFIDIHTHMGHDESETITVQNFYPGEEFPAFKGRNFYSVGLHPWNIESPEENNFKLNLIKEVIGFDHVLFIGECGLDKKVGGDFKEQLRVFEAQAWIAEEMQKPLIIHCVKAYKEVAEMHKVIHPTVCWIFHGYNGSLEFTRQLAAMNIMFTFGKFLFYPASKALDSFLYLPLERLFFETDESVCHVAKMYTQAAELKKIPLEALKKAMFDNFNNIENIRKTREYHPLLDWLKKMFLHNI